MKRLKFLILFFTISFYCKDANAFTCSVSGATDVCPASSVVYHSDYAYNHITIERVTKVRWTCGGNGTFSNGTTTFDVMGSAPNNPNYQTIVWNSTNAVTSWVQVTYYYDDDIGLHFTKTSSIVVKAGYVDNPSSITSLSTICSTLGGSFTVSCPTALPSYTTGYTWSATNATISGTGSSATLYPVANTTDITVSVTANGCGVTSSTFTKIIPRVSTPPPMPTYASGNKASDCVGVEVSWTIAAAPNVDSYTWSSTSPGVTLSPTNIFCGIIASTTGSKTIKVTANNTCGASAARSGIFVASNTGQCGPRSMDIAEDEQIEEGITVFPNPVSDKLSVNINTLEVDEFVISLFDITGKKIIVLNKTVSEGKNLVEMNLNNVDAGIYFMTISNGKTIQKEKIIISH